MDVWFFAMFLGHLGAIIRFYSQLSSLKKKLYLYKIGHRKKKNTPLPLYKIGNPQTEELPPLYKIRKPNKEALQGTCVTLLFYGVLICYFCSILHVFFHRFQYYFVGVTCPFFTGETTVGAQPLETVGHQPPGETQRVTTKGRHHSVYDFKMSSICCGLVI